MLRTKNVPSIYIPNIKYNIKYTNKYEALSQKAYNTWVQEWKNLIQIIFSEKIAQILQKNCIKIILPCGENHIAEYKIMNNCGCGLSQEIAHLSFTIQNRKYILIQFL